MKIGGCKRPDPARLAAHPRAMAHPVVGARLQAHRDGTAALPDHADNLPPSPTSADGQDLDQGQSGSCVWGSLSDAVESSCEAKGIPLPFVPSQDFGYKATRAIERVRAVAADAVLPDLEDGGSDPEDALEIIKVIGCKPMRCEKTPDGRFYDTWTDEDVGAGKGDINAELAIGDIEAAVDTKVLVDPNAHTIHPTDPDAIDLLCAALSSSPAFVVEACGTVNLAFMQLQPGQVAGLAECDPSGAGAGGHAYQFRKYRTNAQGQREFFLKNSWGRWCEGNGCWVSEVFVRQCWALYVIDPTVVKEAA